MSNKRDNIIILVGPTASGKSELAVRLAKRFKGEIISADSRQVYKGLDVGTAKVPGRWTAKNDKNIFMYKGVPHHLIDFASVKRTFTAAEFKQKAQRIIKDITKRGKIPIIAGGTGFWIDALVHGLDLPDVPPNPQLRKSLEGKTTDQLAAMLRHLDPDRANAVDPKNPRRLERAIEIASALGKVPSVQKNHPYNVLWIGIHPDRQTLIERISSRTPKIIRGLLCEIRELRAHNISRKRIRELGFEYSAALDYLESLKTKKQLHDQLIRDTIHYAKRQMTWFKRNPEIHWITNATEAKKLTKNFLSKPRIRLLLYSEKSDKRKAKNQKRTAGRAMRCGDDLKLGLYPLRMRGDT